MMLAQVARAVLHPPMVGDLDGAVAPQQCSAASNQIGGPGTGTMSAVVFSCFYAAWSSDALMSLGGFSRIAWRYIGSC